MSLMLTAHTVGRSPDAARSSRSDDNPPARIRLLINNSVTAAVISAAAPRRKAAIRALPERAMGTTMITPAAAPAIQALRLNVSTSAVSIATETLAARTVAVRDLDSINSNA